MNAKNKKLLAIVGVAAVLLIVIGVSVSMLGKGDQPSGTDPAAAGCHHGGCEPAPGGRNYDAHSGGPRCFRTGKHPHAGTG